MMEKRTILKKHVTPFYLYDSSIIDRQVNTLHTEKPPNLEIFYAAKGNSNVAILKYFADKGMGVEIASSGELFLAKKAKFIPSKIIFTGPAKTDQELKDAVLEGINTIHVESLNEAIRLNNICKEFDKRQSILVRINAKYEVKTKIQLSGCPSPFGISEEEIFSVLPKILLLNYLDFEGIHVYNASGILDYKLLVQNVKNVFLLVKSLEEKLNITISKIDFGGGLGIDYTENNQHVDVALFYKELKSQIELFGYYSKELIMEISRFLVAECGEYITKIIDKKVSRGEIFLITDGGIHHFMRTALFGENHSAYVIQNNPNNILEKVNITGSLCTSIDVISKQINLPKVEIGDRIVIEKTGCYGLNAAINHFLSHEMPTELFLKKKEVRVIRNRGNHQDLLLNQVNYD